MSGGVAAPWVCAGCRSASARASPSDIPGISTEMMAIDHSDASALVDVRRTSSAAVRQAIASVVNRYCPPQALALGKVRIRPVVRIDDQLHPRNVGLGATLAASLRLEDRQLGADVLKNSLAQLLA